MTRFEAAIGRIFRGIFVCRNCKTKMRANHQKILQKMISCKKCGGRAFRPIKSKK